MQDDELEHVTKLTELDEIRSRIYKSLAQEHNWAAQERHYEAQQRQWTWVVILGFVAILINGLKSLWS
ncbi:MAG: hypothetical protein ACC707_18405 [Thiohalomonadales bacterium]